MSSTNKTPFLLTPGRKLSRWEKVGLFVAAVFLFQYWLVVFIALRSGDPWAHKNYWGQHVGTFLLGSVCFFGTVTLLAVVWRHLVLNALRHSNKREQKNLS